MCLPPVHVHVSEILTEECGSYYPQCNSRPAVQRGTKDRLPLTTNWLTFAVIISASLVIWHLLEDGHTVIEVRPFPTPPTGQLPTLTSVFRRRPVSGRVPLPSSGPRGPSAPPQ